MLERFKNPLFVFGIILLASGLIIGNSDWYGKGGFAIFMYYGFPNFPIMLDGVGLLFLIIGFTLGHSDKPTRKSAK